MTTNASKLDQLYQGMPDKPDATEGGVSHYWGAGVYCRRAFVPKHEVVRVHVHEYDHLAIIGSGSGRLMKENEIIEVSAGDVIQIKKGERHAYLATVDTIWLCVHTTSEAEAIKLYGWWGRLKNRARAAMGRLASANFIATLGVVASAVGAASSVAGLFADDGSQGDSSRQRAQFDSEDAKKSQELSDRYRQMAEQYRETDTQQAAKYRDLADRYRDEAQALRQRETGLADQNIQQGADVRERGSAISTGATGDRAQAADYRYDADVLRSKAFGPIDRAYQGAEDSRSIYNVLADVGYQQLSQFQSGGLETLRWLKDQKVDATDRTAEEEGLAANAVKTQAAQGRANTQRALEFARNPGDPGYADIMADSYGNEAAGVAQAITTARRAERERLAGIERENFGRQKAVYDIYGNLAAAGAANVGNAGAAARAGSAIYTGLAGQLYGAGANLDSAGAGADARALSREQLGLGYENLGLAYDNAGAGGIARASAATVGDARAGENAAFQYSGRPASAIERSALAYNDDAYRLSTRGYNQEDAAYKSDAERAAQLGYGGASLASNAKRWFGAIDPKTGAPVATSGGSYMNNGDYMSPGYNFEAGGWGSGFAEGGKIAGPGTGTSDSVSAIKKPGTYILSTDTVRAIGTKKLNDMMDRAGVRPGAGGQDDKAGVPVRLSNGEWSMPPEVTQYYGEEFFNKLQQKHHRPVFSADGAANGGAIRRRALPASVEDAIFKGMPTRAIGRRAA